MNTKSYSPDRKKKYIDSIAGDVCGITGQGHQWDCQPYCRGISRGTCGCGAVRFFATTLYYPEAQKLLDHYNAKHGRPGKAYGGPPIIKNIPKNIPQEIKKEEKMTAQIPAKELPPDMKEKLGINKTGTALAEPPPSHAVTPRKDGAYSREEKKLIAEEGRACASKAARKVIADFYGITPMSLHGWYMVYVINANKERKLTPARLEQLAKARAARGKNKDAAPIAPSAPPIQTGVDNDAVPGPDKTVVTLTMRLDNDQLDKDIAAAREKVEELNLLKLSILPKPRWWWTQKTLRYYMATVERLIGK